MGDEDTYTVRGNTVDESMFNRLEYALQELETLEEQNDMREKTTEKYDPPEFSDEQIDRYRDTFNRAKQAIENDTLDEETRHDFVTMLQDLYVTSMRYADSEDYLAGTRENRKRRMVKTHGRTKLKKEKDGDEPLEREEVKEAIRDEEAKNQREQDTAYDRSQEYEATAEIAMAWLGVLDDDENTYRNEARNEYEQKRDDSLNASLREQLLDRDDD